MPKQKRAKCVQTAVDASAIIAAAGFYIHVLRAVIATSTTAASDTYPPATVHDLYKYRPQCTLCTCTWHVAMFCGSTSLRLILYSYSCSLLSALKCIVFRSVLQFCSITRNSSVSVSFSGSTCIRLVASLLHVRLLTARSDRNYTFVRRVCNVNTQRGGAVEVHAPWSLARAVVYQRCKMSILTPNVS